MNLSRRNFIKTGSSAVAGVMLLPTITGSCSSAIISENVKEYLDHFGVTPEILKKIISVAMSRGGDYADLFFEHKISNILALQDGTVNRAFSNIDYGVGIRVLKGDQTGFAYSESVDEKSMSDAALMAANIASAGNTFLNGSLKEKAPASWYELEKRWDNVSVGEKVPFLQMLNDRVFSLDSKVVKVSASINDETSRILFFSSEGVLSWDYRPLVSMSVVCIMQKGSQIENSYSSRSFRTGFEWITGSLVDELAAEVVSNTNLLFEAVKPRAGEMPVVMGAGGSGILLHEAIGHTFEADFNRKGTSIFSDKMGKKVAADFINIIDDGTLLNNRGSLNIDDEGNEVQKTYLVKDGVLNSYIHDRISAAYYGVEPTGNGRRQDFRNMPLPRMRATYMEAGPYSRDEIFENIKYGVYVDQFSNGEVKIGAGDFTFFAKSGYLIENGRLTQPIKDINIIGNGPQALADITMAADDYLIDNSTWSCGKDGQTVPVTCGLPSVLVRKLTVGGTN